MVRGAREALVVVVAAVLAVASGCGGGDGGNTSPSGPAPSSAPSGKLDSSYAGQGSMLFQSGTALSEMAVAPDGTVVVTGTSLAKLDANGMSIPAFGQSLAAQRYVGSPVLDGATSLYAQLLDYTTGMWSLAMFDAQGQLVPEFGNAGVTPIGTLAGRLLRDGAGQLYVASTFHSGAIESLVVAKYDSTGRQLASYGASGFAKVELAGQSVYLTRAAIDADGNAYLLGSLFSPHRMVVAKLDTSGRLAAGFAAGGIWLGAPCDDFQETAIAVDAGHDVFVGVNCVIAGSWEPRLLKLDAQGNIVASFRDAGSRAGLFSTGSTVWAVLVTANGTIYAGGQVGDHNCQDIVVTKLDVQGNTVSSFGDGGIATVGTDDDVFTGLALDDRGRVYVGGAVWTCGASLLGVTTKRQTGYAVYRLGG